MKMVEQLDPVPTMRNREDEREMKDSQRRVPRRKRAGFTGWASRATGIVGPFALCAVVLVLVAGCGNSGASGATTQAKSGGVVTVNIGEDGSYDDKLWAVAHTLGIDRKLGINLNVEQFTNFPLTQLRRGDLQLVFSCQICAAASDVNFPQYRDVMITNQYKGFVVVGRAGKTKTYAEFLSQDGGVQSKAAYDFVRYLKGKSIDTWKTADLSIVESLMEQGGLTASDVTINDFPDLNKAAEAYLHGTGDYYIGDLDQQAKMLYDPSLKGQFVEAAPFNAFGPGGLWYSTMAASQAWLQGNQELMLKLLAIYYRTTRYLQAEPHVVVPIVAAEVKKISGATFPYAVTYQIMTQLNDFPTWQRAQAQYFAAGSPLNQAKSISYLWAADQKTHIVPKSLHWQTFEVAQEYFDKMLNDPALMRFVNAPL
jgi:ABC-type nitrate/sulfonate/bicarbonate transport system substrate-binding protein